MKEAAIRSASVRQVYCNVVILSFDSHPKNAGGFSPAAHQSLFLEKARPDAVFMYRSNATAFAVSVKAR